MVIQFYYQWLYNAHFLYSSSHPLTHLFNLSPPPPHPLSCLFPPLPSILEYVCVSLKMACNWEAILDQLYLLSMPLKQIGNANTNMHMNMVDWILFYFNSRDSHLEPYLKESNTALYCSQYPHLTGASSCTACPIGSYSGTTGTWWIVSVNEHAELV